jgi:hypothetical protein
VTRHRHGDRDRGPDLEQHQGEAVDGIGRSDEQAQQRAPAEPQRDQQRSVGEPQDLAALHRATRSVARAQQRGGREEREQQPRPARPEDGEQHALRRGEWQGRAHAPVRAVELGGEEQHRHDADRGDPRDGGDGPPAPRRQARVREAPGEGDQPQEQHHPLLPDERRPAAERRVAVVVEGESRDHRTRHHQRDRQRAGQQDPCHALARSPQDERETDAGGGEDRHHEQHGGPGRHRHICALARRHERHRDRRHRQRERERGHHPGDRS